MSHGRRFSTLIALTLATGCSSNELLKPDCHSCTVEEQGWKEFSWNDLVGKWKGSVEALRNSQQATKKTKTESNAELNFVKADTFLQAWGGECKGLPASGVVLNGVLWEGGQGAKEYEAFVPIEDGKVAYGRVSFNKLNGQGFCHFRRIGRLMGKNRLALPSVDFSESAVTGARKVSSLSEEQSMSVEFLRFAPQEATAKNFTADNRRPSSLKDRERPPLMLRVFRVSTHAGGDRGTWTGTEEFVYRLWKAN
jgi:hypothetical protein